MSRGEESRRGREEGKAGGKGEPGITGPDLGSGLGASLKVLAFPKASSWPFSVCTCYPSELASLSVHVRSVMLRNEVAAT